MSRYFFAALLLGSLLPGRAQTLTYTRLDHGGSAPSPRVDGVIVYDDAGGRVFLFGGRDDSPRNDLWVYATAQRAWSEIQTATRPPARFGHTMLLDPARRRLIVFGGQAGGFFSDTWAFDLEGGWWQMLSPDEAGPSRRYGHSAIYDELRDRMVISHGFTDAGRFDDTWAFSLDTNRWTNISPSSGRPLRRCLHHAVYEPAGDRMLFYGGCASGFGPCPLGDLWSFDLRNSRWTELTAAPVPLARQWYGGAYDRSRGRFVVVGGSGAGLLGDTWEFDPGAGIWSQPQIGGAAPEPRERLQGAYAASLGGTLFFGGRTASSLSNELWLLGAPPGRPQVSTGGVVNAFSNDGQGVSPGELVSIFGRGLGPAAGVATSFDPQTGRLPTSTGGVSVAWNGVPGPLYFVGAEQINAQVPYEIAGAQEAEVVVSYDGVRADGIRVPVRPTHPGIFANALHQDGSAHSGANPAGIGSVIVLFATGQGVTSPAIPSGAYPINGVYPGPAAPVELRIGGVEAQVLFAGQAPFTAGVMQINAIVPAGVTPSGTALVFLRVGQEESQPGISIAVRAQ